VFGSYRFVPEMRAGLLAEVEQSQAMSTFRQAQLLASGQRCGYAGRNRARLPGGAADFSACDGAGGKPQHASPAAT